MMPGAMKEAELRAHAKCSLCRGPILQTRLPLFYRFTIDRFGIDLRAVARQTGLAVMLGGRGDLAHAMGPNEDMAKPMIDTVVLTVCETCAMGDDVMRVTAAALDSAAASEVPT